ncbi:copper chaperone CopZ [Motilibacter rhizosphaerae]|uniref:Copper chaperone CopZ n=1 Tax=Motilibacter rhizosphaerae TaxID=598652 RepID=A0A4Q7NYT3_9ACTN|nr:heavy-metal-associated domain-containing protein [Motilibacter rhizosphaerae]RZS91572.1 copper chaperone CopZ [Motilibacter rhizosphaerae]
MSTTTYDVTGMTCGHCVSAVTQELRKLPGVEDVQVQLVPGAVSSVAVTSSAPLDPAAVAEAVDEAGYELA